MMLRWFKNQELARKLILINFILIIIPLGVMSWFAFSRFSATMEKNVGEYQLQAIKQATLNMDTYMNELNRLSLMPYQYEEIMEYLETDRSHGQPLTLEEIAHLNGFVSKVFLNGRIDIMGVSLYGEKAHLMSFSLKASTSQPISWMRMRNGSRMPQGHSDNQSFLLHMR